MRTDAELLNVTMQLEYLDNDDIVQVVMRNGTLDVVSWATSFLLESHETLEIFLLLAQYRPSGHVIGIFMDALEARDDDDDARPLAAILGSHAVQECARQEAIALESLGEDYDRAIFEVKIK